MNQNYYSSGTKHNHIFSGTEISKSIIITTQTNHEHNGSMAMRKIILPLFLKLIDHIITSEWYLKTIYIIKRKLCCDLNGNTHSSTNDQEDGYEFMKYIGTFRSTFGLLFQNVKIGDYYLSVNYLE